MVVEIPPGIRTRIAAIARTYPGVQYDRLDPNAEAIEECARQLGLVPIPADGVPPRSIHGAIPAVPIPELPDLKLLAEPLNPDDPEEIAAAVQAVTVAIHTAICPNLPADPHLAIRDGVLAGNFIHALLDTGWTLARYVPVAAG